MKKTTLMAAAALATTLLAGNALAEDFTACTKDGKTATFSADIMGSVEGIPSLSQIVREAWIQTAAQTDSSNIADSFDLFSQYRKAATRGRKLSADAGMDHIIPPVAKGAPGSCAP